MFIWDSTKLNSLNKIWNKKKSYYLPTTNDTTREKKEQEQTPWKEIIKKKDKK